jgi:hypothetical protein
VAVLVGFLIGLILRFLVWSARTLYRLAANHPVAAVVLVLVAAAEDWIGETVALWALVGLTIWAVLSMASTRLPGHSRGGPVRTARVSVGDGPWQTTEYRDPLDLLSARDRRRWDRAVRRHERQLTRTGAGR